MRLTSKCPWPDTKKKTYLMFETTIYRYRRHHTDMIFCHIVSHSDEHTLVNTDKNIRIIKRQKKIS